MLAATAMLITTVGFHVATRAEDDTNDVPAAASELPVFGPIEHIAHIYGDSIEAYPYSCSYDYTSVHIGIEHLGFTLAESFDPTSVIVTGVDFDGGSFIDASWAQSDVVNVGFGRSGCSKAPSGAVAAMVTGAFVHGDTFSVTVVVP